jgi:hypothetical protein
MVVLKVPFPDPTITDKHFLFSSSGFTQDNKADELVIFWGAPVPFLFLFKVFPKKKKNRDRIPVILF